MEYDPELAVVAGIFVAGTLALLVFGIVSIAKRTPNAFESWFFIRGGWRVAAIVVAAAVALAVRLSR